MINFSQAVSRVLVGACESEGEDPAALAERLGCSPYALTAPSAFRGLHVAELAALSEAVGLSVVDVATRAGALVSV